MEHSKQKITTFLMFDGKASAHHPWQGLLPLTSNPIQMRQNGGSRQ